jgi:hypothetical protein
MAGLGFFSCPDTSSDSEEEEQQTPTTHEEKEAKIPEALKEDGNKLPSPTTLFATVGKPEFLKTSEHFDWDRHVKVFDKDDEDESNIHNSGRYTAIAPPSELDQNTQSISRAPKNYSKTDANEVDESIETGFGMKRKRDKKSSVQDHTDFSQVDSGVPISKRKKGDWYREKEKRKRDLGQSSREKSYVEEEKRILRQSFSVDQQLA